MAVHMWHITCDECSKVIGFKSDTYPLCSIYCCDCLEKVEADLVKRDEDFQEFQRRVIEANN